MIEIPQEFQPIANFKHPAYIENYFEEWFFKKYISEENLFHSIYTKRYYLPIFWTTYYINNGFKSTPELQNFLNNLDKDLKYFTIVQYDDGILENISNLDIAVFSSGGYGDVAIPLLADGLTLKPKKEKNLLCSFIGSETHPIRRRLYDLFKNEKDFFVTLDKLPPNEYLEIMNDSLFTLCPRGYGKTSFRLYEALQLESIPIYVSDEFWLPYKEEKMMKHSILFAEFRDNLSNLANNLEFFTSSMIEEKRNYIKKHKEKFTYRGVYDYIINHELLYSKR